MLGVRSARVLILNILSIPLAVVGARFCFTGRIRRVMTVDRGRGEEDLAGGKRVGVVLGIVVSQSRKFYADAAVCGG